MEGAGPRAAYWTGEAWGDTFNVHVTSVSIARLAPGVMIDDEAMNYLCVVAAQKSVAPVAALLTSQFFEKLLPPATRCAGRIQIDYEGVARWPGVDRVLTSRYVLMPINHEHHWTLGILWRPDLLLQPAPRGRTGGAEPLPCFLVLDSCNAGSPQPWVGPAINAFLERAAGGAGLKRRLRVLCPPVPSQGGTLDCGLFAGYSAQKFVEGVASPHVAYTGQGYPSFITRQWYPPGDASATRGTVREAFVGVLEAEGDRRACAVAPLSPASDSQPEVLTPGAAAAVKPARKGAATRASRRPLRDVTNVGT